MRATSSWYRQVAEKALAFRSATFGWSNLVQGVVLLASATIVSQSLNLLASPVLSRLYSPDEFGVLAVYSSVLGMVATVASLGYASAVPAADDDVSAVNLLFICAVSVLVTSLALVMLVIVAGDWLVIALGCPDLRGYLWMLPLGLCGVGLYETMNSWCIRKRRYSTLARTRVTQGLAQLVCQLCGGAVGLGAFGLVASHVVGESAGVGSLLREGIKKDSVVFREAKLGCIVSVARRYWQFPAFLMWGNLVTNAGLRLPALLLALLYGPKVAGLFYMSQKVLGIPTQLLSRNLKEVLTGELAPVAREDPRRLKQACSRIAKRMLVVGSLPCLGLSVGAEWLFRVVLGEAWSESGVYVQMMCFVFLAKTILDSTVNFAILGRPKYILGWAWLRLVLVLVGVWGAKWLGFTAVWAVGGYTVSMGVAYVCLYLMWMVALRESAAGARGLED